VEPLIGLQKEIALSLAASGSTVTVYHRIQLVQTANFLGYLCMAIPAALFMRS
jgi:hypothetical protein